MGSLLLFLGRQAVNEIVKRAVPNDDDLDSNNPESGDTGDEGSNPVTEEIFSSWALFILLFLLCSALWSSYFLQQRRIKVIHETVLSIFYGMVVGLIIRISPGHYIQDAVKFNSGYFFNILLPPIILNSGYELHQQNFFRNFGSILTFAIPGTFISALVIGIMLYIWALLGLDNVKLEFVDALAVGATLSATDPVTILSIFNAYKVDPKLYTIIFGESLLNDAISIVMFETCLKFHGQPVKMSSFFEGVSMFLMTFTISTIIGIVVGVLVALILKHSHIRRYPQIETCLVLLFAYESYFFSNGAHMSGIVSLLFCGITLKHYAYYNMSRRTQIATKYILQLLAQLSENFIFIYLGLSLFTEVELVFKPLLIIVTFLLICVARWLAVLPLSRFLNFLNRTKYEKIMARSFNSLGSSPMPPADEISHSYQVMMFWAGLRGAVGVALAMGIQGDAKWTLLATVLVVVVLTVIFFGGTTASMLEILGIRIGCVDEADTSDDEFDIEVPRIPYVNSSRGLSSSLNQLMEGTRTAGRTSLMERNGFGIEPSRSYKDDARSRDMINNSTSINPSAQSLINSTNSSAENLMIGDEDMNPSDVDDLLTANSINQTSTLGQHYNGMLGSFLNADEHVKWFTKFDETVLKPVLLDTLPNQKKSQEDTENRENTFNGD